MSWNRSRFREGVVIITLVGGTASGNWGSPDYIGGTAKQIELEYTPKEVTITKTGTGGTAGHVRASTIAKGSVTLTSEDELDTGVYRVVGRC